MIPQADLVVRPKKMIEDSKVFTIPVSLRHQTLFGDELCTWKELISTSGVLPDDIVTGLRWDYEDESDDAVLKLIVHRKREETDMEYLNRIKYEDDKKLAEEQLIEQRDRYEYERLKAKYESDGRC